MYISTHVSFHRYINMSCTKNQTHVRSFMLQ